MGSGWAQRMEIMAPQFIKTGAVVRVEVATGKDVGCVRADAGRFRIGRRGP